MILGLSDVNFVYPGGQKPALKNCNLNLNCQTITVMVGNNGAGKSTLIKLLTGQLYGYSGHYSLDNREADILHGEWLAMNRFGYSPDIPVLDPLLTGLELLLMAGSFRSMTEEKIREEVKKYTPIFDLGDWLSNQVCEKYSKGMKKKVSLIIGFLGDTAYSFLDEPFDGLDPIAIFNLKKHLKERKARGLGTLLSSHMLDAAEKVADEVVIMKDGQVAFFGSLAGLRQNWTEGTVLEEIYFEYFQK